MNKPTDKDASEAHSHKIAEILGAGVLGLGVGLGGEAGRAANELLDLDTLKHIGRDPELIAAALQGVEFGQKVAKERK